MSTATKKRLTRYADERWLEARNRRYLSVYRYWKSEMNFFVTPLVRVSAKELHDRLHEKLPSTQETKIVVLKKSIYVLRFTTEKVFGQ